MRDGGRGGGGGGRPVIATGYLPYVLFAFQRGVFVSQVNGLTLLSEYQVLLRKLPRMRAKKGVVTAKKGFRVLLLPLQEKRIIAIPAEEGHYRELLLCLEKEEIVAMPPEVLVLENKFHREHILWIVAMPPEVLKLQLRPA